MASGPLADELRASGRRPTGSDYAQIGLWLDQQFKNDGVTLVLASTHAADGVFLTAMEHLSSWRIIYLDNRYILFADISNDRLRSLFDDLMADKLKFPDEFSRLLTLSYHYIRATDTRRDKGVAYAMDAFQLKPSSIALLQLLAAARDPKFRPSVEDFCRTFLADFKKHQTEYRERNGFLLRERSAGMAENFLNRK